MNPILNRLRTLDKNRAVDPILMETGAHPLPDDLLCLEDLTYESADGAPLHVDVYRPKDTSSGSLPIAVFVHGGGLFACSRKTNKGYAERVAQKGYMVAIPEYRLIDEADGIKPVSDICSGLSYLECHSAELGGDLSRVLVIGESTGGFLALYATALTASPRLQKELDIRAPRIDVRGLACFGGMFYTAGLDAVGLMYCHDLYGERLKDIRYMHLMNPEDPRIVSSLPPVFMVTSKADFLKGYTLHYSNALARAGHDCKLIYYDKGLELVHGFPSLRPELPQSKEVLDELDAWFQGLLSQG